MRRFITSVLIILLSALSLFIGCQGTPTDDPILPGGRLLGINLEPGNLTIDPGNTVKFIATGIFSGGVEFDLTPFVTWTSSNTSSAFFLSDGTLVADTPGSTLINAKFADVTSQTVTVTVSGELPTPDPGSEIPVIVSIVVTPKFTTIKEEEQIQYRCDAIFSNDTTEDYTNVVVWRISDPTLGFITNNGNFISVGGSGIITVSAKYGAFESNYAVLTIHALP